MNLIPDPCYKCGEIYEPALILTVEDVKNCVTLIEDAMQDYEIAHSMEDDLFIKVLTSIKNGACNPVELAAEALKTTVLDFERHTA